MNYINLGIEFLKVNWITIGLVIFGLITLLSAWVNFKVRLAKITPDKADDIEAEIEKKKVGAFIQLLKDIFLPSVKKKKNDGGFIDLALLLPAICLIVGILCGAFLNQRFRDPDVLPVPTPEYIEVHHYDKDESASKKGKITTTKEFNCPSGGVSKEVSVEDFLEEKQSHSSDLTQKKVEELAEKKVDIFLGGGAQIQTGEKLRDIEKISPQLAAGAAYEQYGGFVASDGNKNHALYAFRHWSY